MRGLCILVRAECKVQQLLFSKDSQQTSQRVYAEKVMGNLSCSPMCKPREVSDGDLKLNSRLYLFIFVLGMVLYLCIICIYLSCYFFFCLIVFFLLGVHFSLLVFWLAYWLFYLVFKAHP